MRGSHPHVRKKKALAGTRAEEINAYKNTNTADAPPTQVQPVPPFFAAASERDRAAVDKRGWR